MVAGVVVVAVKVEGDWEVAVREEAKGGEDWEAGGMVGVMRGLVQVLAPYVPAEVPAQAL